MLKARLLATIIAFAALLGSGCTSPASPVSQISLEFPSGGLRLLVQRDEDPRLFYAALPFGQAIAGDTFVIDDLYTQLASRLHTVEPTGSLPAEQPYGTVTLAFSNGRTRAYLIVDQAFADDLLKRACEHRVDADDAAGTIIAAECAALLAPTTQRIHPAPTLWHSVLRRTNYRL